MPTTFENSKRGISCIYVNYASARLLERSLESMLLYEKTTPFEVIIVNNDETEKELIAPLTQKFQATLVEAFHNPGFGSAANLGARQAQYETLFFVNPDTEWKESFFPSITNLLTSTPNVGAVGVQLVSPAGIPEDRNAGKFFTLPSFFQPAAVKEQIDWLSGGALFVPKSIFQSVKGFDPRFFMYFEDMDLCLRLQKQGYKILLHKEQELIHLSGQSHKTKKSQKKLYDQSLYQYTKKHWPFFHYFFFRLAHPVYRFLFPYGR